jgi:hypothetical protein
MLRELNRALHFWPLGCSPLRRGAGINLDSIKTRFTIHAIMTKQELIETIFKKFKDAMSDPVVVAQTMFDTHTSKN